jgi:rubredoxin
MDPAQGDPDNGVAPGNEHLKIFQINWTCRCAALQKTVI